MTVACFCGRSYDPRQDGPACPACGAEVHLPRARPATGGPDPVRERTVRREMARFDREWAEGRWAA